MTALAVALRRWSTPLPISEFEKSSVSPDHAFLILQNESKNLAAIYELKQEAKFNALRLSWPKGPSYWLTAKGFTCLVTKTNESLDFYVLAKASGLPLYTRELRSVRPLESPNLVFPQV